MPLRPYADSTFERIFAAPPSHPVAAVSVTDENGELRRRLIAERVLVPAPPAVPLAAKRPIAMPADTGMSDTLTYIGSKTIGGTIPGVMAAVAIGKEELEARIAALADFRPAAVEIGAQIATAEAILADLRRAVALGIQPPSIEGQVAAMKQGLSGLLERLAIIRAFYDLCAAAGVDAYWYDGSAAGLGSALAAATAGGLPGGGPPSHCDAIVLATAESATGAAMSEVFGSP